MSTMIPSPAPSQDLGGLPADMLPRMEEEALRVRSLIGRKPRRVLIIGGAGYVGGPLTMRLLRAGYHVRNLDLLVYGHGAAMTGYLTHPLYEFIHGDLCSAQVLDRALEDVSDVIMLAGLVGDPVTTQYPDESRAINDIGIRSCIERLNGRGLNKVIFVSTCSNYGMIPEDELAAENHALTPLSLYAHAKVAVEQNILALKGTTDYHPTILRFATAFGLAPRMRFDLTVNQFVRDFYLYRKCDVYDAETWRPYCHVKDFASVMARVLGFPASEVSFEIFNVGGDVNNHTKQSIAELICRRLPGSRITYKENRRDRRNYKVSFQKLRSKLYFEPSHTVADGIDEIIWGLQSHLFDNVDCTPSYYGNYEVKYAWAQREGLIAS